MATTLSSFYARIAPSRIYFLRFILEGYDGLSVLSTVSVADGIVLLRFPEEARHDLVNLLDSMSDKINTDKEKSNKLQVSP